MEIKFMLLFLSLLLFIVILIIINRYKKYKDNLNTIPIKRRMVITIVVVSILIIGSSILGHFIIPTLPPHNNTPSGMLLSIDDLSETGVKIIIITFIIIFIIGRSLHFIVSYFHSKEQSKKNDNDKNNNRFQ